MTIEAVDQWDRLDTLALAALRHEHAPWPDAAGVEVEHTFLEAVADHGVTALLSSAPALDFWPDGIRSAIRDATRFEIAVEAIRRQELAGLLADLASAGVRGLLLKGAHLAYSHYPHPWLRPRLDTDLLVSPRDRENADRLLRAAGYRPGTAFGGEFVTHQFQYRRTNRYGLEDIIDLHWKIANPHVFADALRFEELHAESIGIDALGPDARGVSPAHALIIAVRSPRRSPRQHRLPHLAVRHPPDRASDDRTGSHQGREPCERQAPSLGVRARRGGRESEIRHGSAARLARGAAPGLAAGAERRVSATPDGPRPTSSSPTCRRSAAGSSARGWSRNISFRQPTTCAGLTDSRARCFFQLPTSTVRSPVSAKWFRREPLNRTS